MSLALSFLLSAVLAWVLWMMLRPLLSRPLFLRTNFRGVEVPLCGGLALVLSTIATCTLYTVAEAFGADLDPRASAARDLVLLATLGFGFLGILDDLARDAGTSGYLGHLRALGEGRLTAGAVKLFGGAAVALLVVAPVRADEPLGLVVDAALVALSANLANLLDRAPGRVSKVALAAWFILVLAAAGSAGLAGTAIVLGATAGLLSPDLRERVMLGDTGANPIGAALGLGLVLSFSPGVRLVALGAVLSINLLSEAVSFSRAIDRVAPLRFLDQLGRLPSRPDSG